jgi:pyocin large subunit-like protein
MTAAWFKAAGLATMEPSTSSPVSSAVTSVPVSGETKMELASPVAATATATTTATVVEAVSIKADSRDIYRRNSAITLVDFKEFDPTSIGLEPSFRLTNYSKLKG